MKPHERTPAPPGRRGAWREVFLTALIALAVFVLGSIVGLWQSEYESADRHFEGHLGEVIAFIAICAFAFAFFSFRRGRQLARESQLRETSEARYRTVVERVPAITYSWDPRMPAGESPIPFVSPQLERILGYAPEEWMKDPGLWVRCIHPEDRDRVVTLSDTADREGRDFVAEYRALTKDGSEVWIHDESVIVEWDPYGRPSLAQGVMFDITRRKRSEERLLSAEVELRRFVEQLPVVTYLGNAEPGAGRPWLRYIAPGVADLTGYEPDEWMSDGELWINIVHPDDRDLVFSESERTDATRERFDLEYRIVRKDGRVVWIHDAAVHSDLDGEGVWLGVLEDVSERKRAEEDRRVAEERYRSLVEQLPVVVYIDAVDDVSTAVYVSPGYERLTGYSAEERLADPDLWVRMLHPDDRERVLDESRRTNATGEPFECEYRLVGRGGRVVWVSDHAVLVGGEDGSPTVWQGVLADITESKRAEEALSRRDRILEAAGYAAERFLNVPAWRDAIDDVLERLGTVVAVSRVYLFENERDPVQGLLMNQRHEWVAEGISSTMDDPANYGFPYAGGFERWERVLGSGDVLHGPVSTAPEAERLDAGTEGILSICVVPVFVAGEWWGFIGLDQCDHEREWQPAEIDSLKVVATTLGAAIGRERAERRLSETEARYRTLVEQIPAITYIEDPVTGRALYISPQLESVLGYTREEWDFQAYVRTLHPDDRERVMAEDARTNETGEPYRVEFRQRAKDGRWVWLRDQAILVRDERGNPLYWQGVRFDITAEKESEEQVRDAEQRYRVLVEQMPAVTYIDGPPGSNGTIYISPQIQEFFGFAPEEWLSTHLWYERLHPDDRDRVIDADERANETGETFSEEYRIVHRDGHAVWVRDQAVLTRDEDGNPAYWQGVYYDITAEKGAEQQLRRTEERFRTLVEQLPAITYIDEYRDGSDDWPTVYISPQLQTILGYSPEEWKSSENLWDTLVHPDDLERAKEADRRHYETGEPLAQEIRLFARDGSVRWIRDEAILIHDDRGRPRWSQGIFMDITERKEAEERLHEAEERYRSLVETIPAAIYIDTVEDISKAIYMSPQVEQIFGYPPDEWLAHPELWEQGLHPDDRDEVVARVERLNHEGVNYEAEYRFRNPRRGWVWVHDQALVIRGDDGRPLFSQGVMFDITERKQAEEQLREAEERFRAIVEHVPAAVYLDVPDASMQTIYVSPQIEQITGIRPDQWRADSDIWVERMHPEDRERITEEYLRSIEERRPWAAEYRLLRPDGTEVWVHDETTFLHDEEGNHTFLQGVLFDVTEQKLAEQALRDSEQRERDAAERLRALDEMKNTFLAAVSHELRSPLTSILGLSLTLERQSEDLAEADQADLLERLATNARKLDRLLKDLLDIDRLNRGIVAPQYRVTDVGALARRTVETLEALADRTIDVRAEAVVLSVDPAKVERIVENLLMNAARHTDPDHRIWLRVAPAEGGVLIAVEDDGPGVPEHLREAIFEPFRQGPSVSKASPGTGIGLSLVARFAELHGGRAWVEDRDGGGAAFRVLLPAGPADGGMGGGPANSGVAVNGHGEPSGNGQAAGVDAAR